PVFQRMVESREPFWATIDRGDRGYRVYFLTDRGGIYALGYPVVTWFGHLVNLAELVLLTAVVYIALLVGSTVFSAVASGAPTGGGGRSDHGSGRPRHRRGRQSVRSRASSGDKRARFTAAHHADAGLSVPGHPARSAADLCRR